MTMVIFHHIPKTGGMAVMANVARCNPSLNIQRRDAPFLSDAGSTYPEFCDVLHGHFAYEKIPPGAVRFTFARHPIARFSSSFYSLRQVLRSHGIQSIRSVPAPTIRVTFAGGVNMTLRKEQCWFLDRIEDFTDAFLITGGTFGLGLIREVFMPDFRRQYDFIGVTEKMNESMVKLNKLIRTDASRMTVVNASNSGEIRYRVKELEDFYGEEIETYHRICA